ncbi:hypothetical protein CBL_04056 [Carabus blaptoides fortunei]
MATNVRVQRTYTQDGVHCADGIHIFAISLSRPTSVFFLFSLHEFIKVGTIAVVLCSVAVCKPLIVRHGPCFGKGSYGARADATIYTFSSPPQSIPEVKVIIPTLDRTPYATGSSLVSGRQINISSNQYWKRGSERNYCTVSLEKLNWVADHILTILISDRSNSKSIRSPVITEAR